MKAKASPTKAFFVRMLTRDISLTDCILDLVDNSVDGAWELAGARAAALQETSALAERRIDIHVSESRFAITDNCGGITLDDAVNYAFTFGRREDRGTDDYSVGVYGIGMKRAIFKIGESIEIASTTSGPKGTESFVVPIHVPTWSKAEDWDFDIAEGVPGKDPGVEIEITDLTREAALEFSDESFPNHLRETLAIEYLLPLLQGLHIFVNGVEVERAAVQLRAGEGHSPMRDSYADAGVSVEIIAGMHAPPPDTSDPEDPKRADQISGWYVACNGRIVLPANRDESTGWGVDGLPKWHHQYSGFIGFVLFSAANPELLPMTTTKRDVDRSSLVYRRAIARMREPARAWINYTNSRKSNLDEAKEKERSLQRVELTELPERTTVAVPVIARSGPPPANVSYAVPRPKLKLLASALGDISMSYREVGIRTFEYTFDELVDE